MMSQNKIASSDCGNNNALNLGSTSVDPLLHSESPKVQQIRLYQQLREELEKNSSGRLRYVDSDFYSRNRHDRTSSPSSSNDRQSEVQSATLNFAQSKDNNNEGTQSASIGSPRPIPSSSRHQHSESGDVLMRDSAASNVGYNEGTELEAANSKGTPNGRGCQVCLIKEVKEDLINVTKIIQDRNEKLSKLKARHLRSFFERQMLD